ncbi:hypothetical protein LJB42_000482 [Komagataella kurtzmanii]|nr:hypothetical protein LJB42_000482 [Komagataella kurtzmanii]
MLYRRAILGSRVLARTIKTSTSAATTGATNFELPQRLEQHGMAIDMPHKDASQASKYDHLKGLSASELINYGVIGMATINKPILDLVIKIFPYVPMVFVKMFVYNLYCGGQTVEDVRKTGQRLKSRGIQNMMASLTIEGCNGNDNIDIPFILKETNKSVDKMIVPHTLEMIKQAENINDVAPGYVALKPTGMAEDAANVLKNYNKPEYRERFEKLVDNCRNVTSNIYKTNIDLLKKYPDRVAPFVVAVIDAEKHQLQQGVYELQRRLFKEFNPKGKPVSVAGTIQMYLKEGLPLIELENKLAAEGNYRVGLKLVRGAYIHSEPDRNVIHDTKQNTDYAYDSGVARCIQEIVNSSSLNGSDIGHLVVASHSRESQMQATTLLDTLTHEDMSKYLQRSNVVLGQLLGMADDVTHTLITKYGVKNLIKYVPWGPSKETKDYLLRRLEENGDAVRADNGWPLVMGVVKTLFQRIIRI